MSNYYCLVAGLPDLSLEDNSIQDSIQLFRDNEFPNLARQDKDCVSLFFLKYDNANLINMLSDPCTESFDSRGLLSREELENLISAVENHEDKPDNIPAYMWDFVESELISGFDDDTPCYLLREDTLSSMYYRQAMSSKKHFVADWFEFNLNVNNILTALTARRFNFDATSYLVGENDIVNHLKNTMAPDFGLSREISYINDLVSISQETDPATKERRIDRLKWDWIENESIKYNFSIEVIFSYLIKLDMVDRWMKLDAERGENLLRNQKANNKGRVAVPVEK